MSKTIICTYDYRAYERDWAAGQLVVVSDADATRLLGFQLQVGSSVRSIFRDATAEESTAAGADGLAWGVPVTRLQVPPRSELAQLPLEALRANGVSHGIAGAHDLTQDELLDAFDRLARRADAPSATVTPLPLGGGAAVVPPVSPPSPDSPDSLDAPSVPPTGADASTSTPDSTPDSSTEDHQ